MANDAQRITSTKLGPWSSSPAVSPKLLGPAGGITSPLNAGRSSAMKQKHSQPALAINGATVQKTKSMAPNIQFQPQNGIGNSIQVISVEKHAKHMANKNFNVLGTNPVQKTQKDVRNIRKIKEHFVVDRSPRKAEKRPKVLINCEKIPDVADLSKSITASLRM